GGAAGAVGGGGGRGGGAGPGGSGWGRVPRGALGPPTRGPPRRESRSAGDAAWSRMENTAPPHVFWVPRSNGIAAPWPRRGAGAAGPGPPPRGPPWRCRTPGLPPNGPPPRPNGGATAPAPGDAPFPPRGPPP